MAAWRRLACCVLLPPLAGCLIDRGALMPDEMDTPDASALDARGTDDAWSADQDAGARDEDAGGRAEDAARPVDAARAADAARPVDASATCGDRVVGGGEECDDGNVVDGDGCDARCLHETSRRVVRGPGLALAIPDDAYDGSLRSMTCVDLDVRPFPLDTLASLEVALAMRHTWVADLVIKLVGPGGSPVVTLMSRPNINEPADDGTRMNGNDADLDPAFPIRFVDGAAVSAEDMGDGIGNRTVCEADGVCVFAPNAGAATPGDLSSFVGGPASGAWRFCVGDAAGADLGTIDAVTLVMGLR